jgi:hypothetical protein
MTRSLFFVFIFSFVIVGCLSPKDDSNLNPHFEKVIFHTSACLGFCSTYHIEISKNKSFKLFAENVFITKDDGHSFKRDSSLIGYFVGQIADSTFYRLDSEIKNIGLDSLVFPKVDCCDLPEVTLIVYYNEKRKYLKSLEYPDKANELIRQLRSICEMKNLKKANEHFDIEK